MVALTGLLGVIAVLLPFEGWISGVIGVGSLTVGGAFALCRRRQAKANPIERDR
jgi:hypothetical protein